ncbi:MAG TPA: fatty acid cis/trans isomerase [Burkholderiales bacterium]|nr:fatty acid cis/trans isomerase [Burkholderiales bacterium]
MRRVGDSDTMRNFPIPRPMRRILLILCLAALAGCATLARQELDRQYGAPDPARFDTPQAPPPAVSYRRDVQPILDRRCVVCHACYDAQCQLKLTAWEGVARGASKEKVYDGARLDEAQPTRLFVDAQNASQWRAKGFYPVLNERTPSPEANLSASVLYRMLDLKRRHPLPGDAVLPKSFDFSLDRDQQCARLDEFDGFEREYPLWGMPYGLPGLSEREQAVLARWLELGWPYEGPPPLPESVQKQVKEWEAFLNGDSLKERLASRYLYEHLFLAQLYFEADPAPHYFRLVRSATPPGQPVKIVATRRPYDDPGMERVYYRLVPERETIVAKTHMPYALGPKRMARWREWFVAPDYKVEALPSYDVAVAANPFVAFRSLPVKARYGFLLDEAQYTIMNFIKGPVCRGQLALDVIEDQFWVFFVDPVRDPLDLDAEFLAREAGNLRLPSEAGSDARILATWIEYSRLETKFLKAKLQFLQQHFGGAHPVTLDLIWDGDGRNPNAALTVFRHFDSASVVQGLVGEPPKTAWVIGYPLLERIHYLLVAGFDVYGNAGHQLNSRLYMDFLRMEGEFNFLTLLPQAERERLRNYWYRGAKQEVKDYVYGRKAYFDRETGIKYRSSDPQRELYGLLQARLKPVLPSRFGLATVDDPDLRRELEALAALRGQSLAWLPEVAVLRVDQPPRAARYFTLLKNTGHSNVTHVFTEGQEILPREDTLTVVPGFIGAYPNALYALPRDQLPQLAEAVAKLASEADYRALADRYAIRRSRADFWEHSDALQDAHAAWSPLEAGLFDYNRLENR